jgi:hypothetical protein
MTRIQDVLQLATPFVWLGMVLAISALETPLKFRAPGITRALGLGIGRLVFRALNIAELVLLAVLTLALAGTAPDTPAVVLVAGLWTVLLSQVIGLRPALDRRVRLILDGASPPPSSLHHLYIALEGLKLVALAVLGTLLALQLVR